MIDPARSWLAGLLTPQEAAEALGVHPESLRRWIRCGRIEAFRLGDGREYRLSSAALREFLQPTKAKQS